MDPKLTMLLILFGSIIALSNLRVEHITRLKDSLSFRRGRKTGAIPG